MNYRLFLILMLLYLKTSFLSAIPHEIEAHIERDFAHYIQELNNLGYSDEHEDRVINNHIDGLVKLYKDKLGSFNQEEVKYLIKSKLKSSGPSELLKITFSKSSDEITDINQLREIVDKFVLAGYDYKTLVVSYRGASIPLFLSKYYGKKILMSVDGISIDSKRKGSSLLRSRGVSGAFTCMKIILEPGNLEAELSLINADYMACPLPKGAGGTYILGLAEELARKSGKEKIFGDDQATMMCEKNGKTAKLSRWTVFKLGKTWHGLYGYRTDRDDDLVTQSHRSFPLLAVKDELENIMLNKASIEQELLKMATYPYKKKDIESAFANFDQQKQIFDDEVAAFSRAKAITEPTVGQFFSWLWDKDCARYTELEEFLYHSDASKNISLRKLKTLPDRPTKKL